MPPNGRAAANGDSDWVEVQPEKHPKRNGFHHQESTATETTVVTSLSSTFSSLADDDEDTTNTASFCPPLTTSLPLLLLLDMLGVALVVPLLQSQYLPLAGVTKATHREWLASVFSASQILGGVTLGSLSDSGRISRTSLLAISFVSSAVAYALLGVGGGLPVILVSRVLVGLFKQTMTITTALMSQITVPEDRAIHMRRLNSGMTVAFIVGPSAGAYLFSHAGTYVPIYVSCSLFMVNIMVLWAFVTPQIHQSNLSGGPQGDKTTAKKEENVSTLDNLRQLFFSNNNNNSHSGQLASIMGALLLLKFVHASTVAHSLANFYEQRFDGFQTHWRGYLDSYQAMWRFFAQLFLVKPILGSKSRDSTDNMQATFTPTEVWGACGAAMVMALISGLETMFSSSFLVFVVVVCPVMSIATAVLRVALKTTLSKVAPHHSLGRVLATLDVLMNVAGVSVPLYRTWLFSKLAVNSDIHGMSTGDPDPTQWVRSASMHWAVFAVVLAYLLLYNRQATEQQEAKAQNTATKIKAV